MGQNDQDNAEAFASKVSTEKLPKEFPGFFVLMSNDLFILQSLGKFPMLRQVATFALPYHSLHCSRVFLSMVGVSFPA